MKEVLEGLNPADLSGKTIDLLTQHIIMQQTREANDNKN